MYSNINDVYNNNDIIELDNMAKNFTYYSTQGNIQDSSFDLESIKSKKNNTLRNNKLKKLRREDIVLSEDCAESFDNNSLISSESQMSNSTEEMIKHLKKCLKCKKEMRKKHNKSKLFDMELRDIIILFFAMIIFIKFIDVVLK